MDSDDEDVTEHDILDWYKREVSDIWDTATDSAFADLSSNLTDVFRQVMNDVKQRSSAGQQPVASGSSAVVTNGHSSNGDGHGGAEAGPSTSGTNTVTLSSDQLMAMLEDDDDWAEEVLEEEEMMLSVQLTDDAKEEPKSSETTDEDQKNVKGVSREVPEKHFAADSAPFFLLLVQTAFRIVVRLVKWSLLCTALLVTLYAASILHTPLQRWFLRHAQDHIYTSMRLLRLATLPLIQLYPSLTGTVSLIVIIIGNLIFDPLYRRLA